MLHPRNRHQGRYDFKQLKATYPELRSFVARNQYGDDSIDFANPEAVKCLNRALLFQQYGVKFWDIPKGFLCPPIPGRADYIHLVADLLSSTRGKQIPRKSEIKGLDIGVGANCIYPILGFQEYGWHFVGADINPVSLSSAQKNIDQNEGFAKAIQLRLQSQPQHIFKGIIQSDDLFHFTICNPPFHASMEEAQNSTRRKLKNLGKLNPKHEKQVTNFGGQESELWCPGGELAFIGRMIEESVLFQKQCEWFTVLVSKEESLPKIYALLKKHKAKCDVTLNMAQGQKKSRIVAWSFHHEKI